MGFNQLDNGILPGSFILEIESSRLLKRQTPSILSSLATL
jgi:hypothetical protein